MENNLKTAAKKEFEYMKNLNPTHRYDGKEEFYACKKRQDKNFLSFCVWIN